MKPFPCTASEQAYAQIARASTAEPAKPPSAHPRRRATFTTKPPAPPASPPTSTPSASSATAAPGPMLAACSAVAAPAMATKTTGVAIPSLSPLSMLSSRRIRAGTAGFTITPAPRAASVGARAAPTSRASQTFMPLKSASASSIPRPIVSGSPTPSSRRHRPRSARRSANLTRDASENSTRTRVISASAFTNSWEGAKPSGASRPWVSSKPASTKMIGAVTSYRSSRADSAPQTKTIAATIAASEALTGSCLPSRGRSSGWCRGNIGWRDSTGSSLALSGLVVGGPAGAGLVAECGDGGCDRREEVVWVDRAGEPVAFDLPPYWVLEFGEHQADALGVQRLVELGQHIGGGGVHVGHWLRRDEDP